MEPNIMELKTKTSAPALGIYSGSYRMPGVRWLPNFDGEGDGAPATPPVDNGDPPAAATGSEPAAEPATPPAAESPAEPPASTRTPWYTRRIAELTRARNELEQGVGQTRAERDLLQARVEELEAQLAAGNPADPPKPPAKPAPAQRDFNKAVQEEAQRLAGVAAFNKTCNDIYNAGVKAHGDAFKTAIAAVQENFQGIPPTVIEAALEAAPDKAHSVIHEIVKDLDTASEIFQLSPVRQATAVARIAAKLSTPAQVSGAPKPIAPVTGRSPTSEPTLEDPNMDTATWMERRQKEVMDKRQRGVNIR